MYSHAIVGVTPHDYGSKVILETSTTTTQTLSYSMAKATHHIHGCDWRRSRFEICMCPDACGCDENRIFISVTN
jgi:hypothetical protein